MFPPSGEVGAVYVSCCPMSGERLPPMCAFDPFTAQSIVIHRRLRWMTFGRCRTQMPIQAIRLECLTVRYLHS
jgi:hypothetical protein